MNSVSSGILVILGLAVCATAQCEEVFYDYAQVSAVELLKDDAYRRADKTGPLCGQQLTPRSEAGLSTPVASRAVRGGRNGRDDRFDNEPLRRPRNHRASGS